jgi:PPOX class probable F420-dependent enzyme
MGMNSDEARERFAAARVARLATVTPDGRPHLVPVVFALERDVLHFAVDRKPKTTTALRRLANIAENPAVSLLVDHYAEDWTQLWWVRGDGAASVQPATGDVLARLAAKYPPYADDPPPGPVVEVAISRWTGWRASTSS